MSIWAWWRKFVTFIYDRQVITLVDFDASPGVIVKPTGYKRRPIGYPRYFRHDIYSNYNDSLLVKPIYKVEEVFHGQLVYHSGDGQKQKLIVPLAKPTKAIVLTELQRSFTQGSQYVLRCYLGMFSWLSNDVSGWYVTRR